MGSCSSIHRNTDTTDMKKLKLSFGSKTDNLVIHPSPIKEKAKNGNLRLSPSRSTTKGSKEEAFFDSKPWLDSDCEGDFYSVNGDFTPSRGTTPVHHIFGTPAVNKTPFENRIHGSCLNHPQKRKRNCQNFFEKVSKMTKMMSMERKKLNQLYKMIFQNLHRVLLISLGLSLLVVVKEP